MKIPKAFGDLFKPSRLKVYHGGRGGAKSESIARYLLWAAMKESMTVLCAREFMNSIRDSVYQLLASLIEQYNLKQFYTVKESEIVGKNGSKFIFMGLRRNIENIKSIPNIKRCWVEEAETVTDRSWNILLPTIRGEGSEIIVSFNPDIEESPTYQRMVADPPPFAIVKYVTYRDNPYFPDVLEMERKNCQEKRPDVYENIWEGKPRAAVEGSIFAKELEQATKENRITTVPYDPTVPVCTYWDLGRSALTAIWFVQYVGMQWRVLRHYSNHLEDLNHYLKYIQSLPYVYEKHYLPHDSEQKRIGMALTVLEQAQKVLKHVVPVPRIVHKADAINAAKQIFPLCYFDKENCSDGLSDLRHYAYRVTEDGKISNEPEEGNFYRDTADAFMCFAQAHVIPKPPKDELEELVKKQNKLRGQSGKAWWK